MTRGVRTILALVLLAGPAGCREAAPDYFPLGSEQQWEYRISRTIKGEERHQRLIVSNLEAAQEGDAMWYPRRRLDGRIELFQKTGDGITMVDRESGARARILPAELKEGAQWQEQNRIMFLEVTGVFSPTFRDKVRNTLPVDYVIDSTDDTVEVAAGRFRNCLRVRGSGSIFAGSTLKTYMGIRFIKVEVTEWYAPGVGLVKSVRDEFTTPAEWNNRYEQELLTVR